MTFQCPQCHADHTIEPRYCTECGTEVAPNASFSEIDTKNAGFFERHKLMILSVAGFLMLPISFSVLTAAPDPAFAIGFLIGAGGAALCVSYVLVFLGTSLINLASTH